MGRDDYGLHGPFDGRIGLSPIKSIVRWLLARGHHLSSSFIDCRMLFAFPEVNSTLPVGMDITSDFSQLKGCDIIIGRGWTDG